MKKVKTWPLFWVFWGYSLRGQKYPLKWPEHDKLDFPQYVYQMKVFIKFDQIRRGPGKKWSQLPWNDPILLFLSNGISGVHYIPNIFSPAPFLSKLKREEIE